MHQIGVGVLGPVYRTYESAADRLVAVKAFHLDITPEQAQALVDALNRLVASDLSHRGVVAPLAVGLEDGIPYMAQEYVAAESLDVAIRHYAPASLDAAMPFITGIAAAVDAAHERGVVHGALHLRDIFVSPDEVRITGFGVATVVESIGLAVSIRRPYTAPEVIAGRAWRGEADLYTLAAVTYELLTGRRIAGFGEQVTARLQSVSGVADPDALQAAFVTALADAPEERYSSGARFAAALSGAVGDRSEASETDLVKEAPVLLSGHAVVPDLLAGLDLRRDEPAADAEQPSVEPAAGNSPFDDDAVDATVNRVMGAPDQTEVVSLVEPDEPVSDLGDAEQLTDDAVGVRDEYSSFEVTRNESNLEFKPIELSAASAGSHESPHEAGLFNDWEGETAELYPREFNHPVDDAGSTDDYDEEFVESAPVQVVEPNETSGLRRIVPFGAMALVIGMVAYFIGMGFGPEGEPGDRVLGQDDFVEAPATEPSSERIESGATGRDRLPPSRVMTVSPGPPATLTPEKVISEEPIVAASSLPNPALPVGGARSTPAAARSADGGWLLFRTEPPGATVLVNGVVRGVTPLSIRDIPFGEHEVEVRREGFVAAKREVIVRSANLVVPIAFQLLPADEPVPRVVDDIGSIAFESRPLGARVVVNNEVVGVTPVAIPISPGRHILRMERDGYEVWSTTVDVTEGERVQVAASLERIPR